MDAGSSILQLEAVVEKLIIKFQALQQECDGLSRDLAAREEEVVSLRDEINQLQGERQDVHGRVSAMLGKLEAWEMAQDVAAAPDSSEDKAKESDSPAKLFSMEA
ncbi:MAG: cell division protein ZapB [Thermodesulfobacteriota bacterium]